MANQRNMGVAIGRLTREPHIFTNSDGSSKVMITLAVAQERKNKDGKRETDFIQLEAFVAKPEHLTVYKEYMHKGDMINVMYTVKSSSYTNKDGKTVYTQALRITGVDLMETKAAVNQRQNAAGGNALASAEPTASTAAVPEAADQDFPELNDGEERLPF